MSRMLYNITSCKPTETPANVNPVSMKEQTMYEIQFFDKQFPVNDRLHPRAMEVKIGWPAFLATFNRLSLKTRSGNKKLLAAVLYLCSLFPSIVPPKQIEEDLHSMILDTPRYAKICKTLYNGFLDHIPD